MGDVPAELCREGEGRLIGFHPEGTRNKSEDPYSFLTAQSGIGRLILEARPQLIPVFIAGLSNSLGRELRQGVGDGGRIRVYFGELVDYRESPELTERIPARAVAEDVMRRIRALAEEDRDGHNPVR